MEPEQDEEEDASFELDVGVCVTDSAPTPDEEKKAASSDVVPESNAYQETRGNDPQSPQSAGHDGVNEKLDRELSLSKMHRMQLQGRWRKVLCREKFRELHGGIPQLIKYHDQNVTRKREVIHSLREEVSNLQELYQDAMVANMNRMEDLIAIHDDQVAQLERDFRDRVSSSQSRFHIHFEQINAQYEKEKEAIRRCIQHQDEKDECQTNSLQQKHQHELEEIKNRHLEHVNGLRFVLDSRVEDLEGRFEQTQEEFALNAEGAQAAHDQLKLKEERMRREIESMTHQANDLQREIQRFQLIARQEEAQTAERHEELRSRKARAIARWNATQGAMVKFREGRQKRLAELILRANERKDALRGQCELAERVKKIASACQMWESSRERFASLLRDSVYCPTVEKLSEEESVDSRSLEQDMERRSFVIDCMGRLGDRSHHFWNKYNMSKLDVLTLEKEIRSLRRREGDLKDKLETYQNGITINNDVLKDRNPLFVINGNVNVIMNNGVNPGKRNERRRLTVVDGNHFFATNIMAQVE